MPPTTGSEIWRDMNCARDDGGIVYRDLRSMQGNFDCEGESDEETD